MNDIVRIGFYVKNSFQVDHLAPLFRQTPGAKWIAKNRKKIKALERFSSQKVVTSIFRLRSIMDKDFDFVISHANPPGKRKLLKSKFIMVQYGYAKEPYNFGAWRENADLILAYGEYARAKFSKRARSLTIGNPRWDDWTSSEFKELSFSRLQKYKHGSNATILYAPTWGSLSSISDWIKPIIDLSKNYSVIIKTHHNSKIDSEILEHSNSANIHFLPGEDLFSLFCVADVVISDFSGAIFDAILCELPVVLVAPNNFDNTKMGKKLNLDSIEIRQRSELGYVVKSEVDLRYALNTIIEKGFEIDKSLYNNLFNTNKSVWKNFISSLKD
jgi:hypothetical protein